MATAAKIIGVAAAFGLGYLLLRPRQSRATSVMSCNDEQGVRAWTIQENLSVIMVRKKSDFVGTSEPIDALVIADSCEVYEYSTTQSMYVLSARLTKSLRDFLASLIPVSA